MGMRRLILLTAGTGVAVVLCTTSLAYAGLPSGFFGVVPQGPLRRADYQRMRGTVETLRMPVEWGQVEPAPGAWDFATVDRQVEAAGRRGIAVMPVLYGLPGWLDLDPARAPRGARERQDWAGFVRRLVRRYGPGGDLWQGNPLRFLFAAGRSGTSPTSSCSGTLIPNRGATCACFECPRMPSELSIRRPSWSRRGSRRLKAG